MTSSTHTNRLAAILGCCLFLTVVLAWVVFPPAQPEAPAKIIRDSWNALQSVGQYDFATTVEQRTYPAPALANVGQSSTKEIYQISGKSDLHNNTLEIRLFQNQGSLLNQTNGVEIRVAGGKAAGRPLGAAEWQPLDDYSSVSYDFGKNSAPFISAARNVREEGKQTIEIPDLSGGTTAVSVTRYSFNVDSNVYASEMRDLMVAELQRSGKLPLGMQLSVSDQYRGMVASGQIWVSEEGLPVRMVVTMKMPPEKTGEHVESTITTDYFNHNRGYLMAAQPLPYRLAGALGLPTNPKALGELTMQFSLFAGSALLLVLLVVFSNKKFVYAGVAGLVILSMLITPVWTGEKAAAFAEEVRSRNASIEAERQRAQEERQAYEAAYTSDWDPHTNPLERIQSNNAAKPQAVPSVAQPVPFGSLIKAVQPAQDSTGSDDSDVDTDGDGLTDAFEIEVNRYVDGFDPDSGEYPILDPTKADTDGDGLDDGVELKLNLAPGLRDSDSDGIADINEVRSFYHDDRDWYLNPEERDTDLDGQIDGVECPERTGDSAGTCRDTDGDGIPDAFDPDDDNDGIPTAYDESPYVMWNAVYSHDNPLKLSISGLAHDPENGVEGKPVFINYQFVPTNEKHLTYALHVLDWPSGDTDGQIQRISDSTFADSLTPEQKAADPRAQYGDMRMIPMVEIKFTGNSYPFPLTDRVKVDIDTTGFSGSFDLRANVHDDDNEPPETFIVWNEGNPDGLTVKIGQGTCDEYKAESIVDNVIKRSLGELVSGDFVVAFFNGDDLSACAPIPAVAHGKLSEWVIDSTELQKYGGAARDDGEGNVLVYAPLMLVYDETGGHPVAFSTRIPYTNQLNGFSESQQEVRIVWMINMLTDQCLPVEPGYDESVSGDWCNPAIPERWNKDVARIVHTYNEEFTLAGLSVVEDYGVEMAVIFEDPLTDSEPDFDDPLWAMAHALERTFLTGREDITVDEIQRRFSPNHNADTTDVERWSFAKDTFQVERYSYTSPDGVEQFVSTQVQKLFDDYFKFEGAPDIATLLFAREITQRATSIGEAGQACDANGCTLNLTDKPLVTQAMLNWSPYQRKDGVWQPYDINEFLDQLEARLRGVDIDGSDATYADATEEKQVINGMITMAKLYYSNLYSGIATLVMVNGKPAVTPPKLINDEDVFNEYNGNLSKGKLVGKVISFIVGIIVDGHLTRPTLIVDIIMGTRKEKIQAFLYMVGAGIDNKTKPLANFLTSTFRKVAVGIAVAVAVAGLATLAILYIVGGDSKTGKWAGRILFFVLQSAAAVMAGASLYSAIKAVKCVSDNAKAAAVIGAVIGVVIAWGVFFYTWASSGASIFGLAFNNMLAEAIAATVTVCLMAALSATGVGAIIVAIIGLIDALIGAICAIAGANELDQDHWARQYVCIGLTGWVTKIIKWVIYSNTYLIDYDNGERLEFNEVDQDLQYLHLGMSYGNNMKVTVGVKNTIKKSSVPIDWKALAYAWQYSDSNAKSATFSYKLQTTESDIHDGLNRGDIASGWVSLGGSKWYQDFKAESEGYSIPLPKPGINVDPTVYLSEGSAVPVQECWAVPVFYPIFFLVPVCYIRTERATINIEMSSSLTVDVFPQSLDDFYSMTGEGINAGLKLSWGQSGSVKFPTLRDADGDGLMSKAYSGNDPDDSSYDTDNDGLSDYFELTFGSNPRLVDTDDDGLPDYLEVLAQTSPTRKDTDGDGLTDLEEVNGWLYTYGFDETGAPLETMVYSDPLMADSDLDGLTDYLERVYGFHPRVSQNSDVLDYELTVREQDSPLIMLRLNESSGSMVFEDSSNFGFAATCTAEECPLAGVDGRYAGAASFDGSDLLRLPTTAKTVSLGDDHPFTIAGWVKTEGGGTLFSKWSEEAGSQKLLRFEIDGSGHLLLASSAGVVTSMDVVPSGVWTYVAVIFDGNDANFFINGNPAGGADFSVPAPPTGSTPSEIILGAYQGESGPAGYFQGYMDEVLFFDFAITEEVLGRWMDGRYNFNDSFVRPGEELVYRSTVTNLLNSRYAYGLLTTVIDKVNAVVDWASKLLPKTFVLYPDNPVVTEVNTEVFETQLQIEPDHQVSEDVTFTQTAEAQIVDRRTESNLAELWLQFNEPEGAKEFEDFSGNMPPRHATCTVCPESGHSSILNTAVKFTSGSSQQINLPNLETLKLIGRGFTIAMWVRPMDTNVEGARIPLLQSTSNQLRIDLVRQDNSTFLPEVWVGGVQQTYSSWRTMKASVWSHLVVEYFSDSNTLKIFINGGQIASINPGGAVLPFGEEDNADLWLGGSPIPTDFFVDDLRIFSRPLSITDVNRMAEQAVLEMNMDDEGTGFSDSSGYGTTVNYTHSYPFSPSNKNTQSVRGQSFTPNTGISQRSLTVSGNPLLDMSDGSFTFSVWVYPKSGSPDYWQGIFGKRESDNDAHAYPTLERKGRQLRFGFGDGSGYRSQTTGDILTENAWNHVTITFAPSSFESGTYVFKLYINSTLTESTNFTYKPAAATSFYLGTSSISYTLRIWDLYMEDEHDAGSKAEPYIKEYRKDGYYHDALGEQSMGDDTWHRFSHSHTLSDFGYIRYEVWEADSTSGDDLCGSISRYWSDLPESGVLDLSNGFDGTLRWEFSRPSIQFYGLIDELEVYRYAIDSEQVYDQYYAIPVTARLPLDDRPASDMFENRAIIGDQDDGTCSEPGCPAAGTIGLINQAVRFDGEDDVIDVRVETTSDYMVTLWLNSTCQNCGVYSLEKEGGALVHQLYLRGGNICSLTEDDGQEICSHGGTVTDGQWHYVVYTNNGRTANLWLDGAVVNSRSSTTRMDTGKLAKLGFAPAASNSTLNGQLDDVRIFRYIQTDDEIKAIQRRAPIFLAHLDEPDGASSFEDATPNDFQLECSGAACPTTQMEGRLHTAVEFNEPSDVLTLKQTDLSTTAKGFSALVWVYPTETRASPQSILTIANGNNSAPRAVIALEPDQTFVTVQHAAGQNPLPKSNVELIKNTWNLITLVVEPNSSNGETFSLYINGYLDSSWTSPTAGTGLGKITLGNSAGFSGFAGGPYFGRIDEVAIYEYALNEIDVRDIFAYQMSQVEETASITMTIDADAPQAELVSYNEEFPYINEADRVLHVEASDPTSGIGMVEMVLDHPNAPDEVRTVAPICQDAPGGTAYCPTFIPEYGDGVYTLSFRAVDLVGHESTSRSYQFLVDRDAPTIFANLLDQGLYKAERHKTMKKTWFLHLEGRVLDKTIGQDIPGSGLDLNSMKVTIYSEKGEVVGKGTQVPVLTPGSDGYNWSLDYLFPEKEPTGRLKIVIEIADRVGNVATHTIHILLDATSPRARMTSNQALAGEGHSLFDTGDLNDKFITGGTVNGTVNDVPDNDLPYMTDSGVGAASGVVRVETAFEPSLGVSYLFNEPYPEGLLAWLPLDNVRVSEDKNGVPNENAPERYFLDISPFQFSGVCYGATCPVNGEIGHKNGSIYFDGDAKSINLGSKVDLSRRSFSALIWARLDAPGRAFSFMWQGPQSDPAHRFHFGMNDDDQIVCDFGGSALVSANAFPDTGWHAYACTYDIQTGKRTIYRDGQQVASDSANAVPEMNEDLLIGSSPVGSFAGSLDELMVLDRALSAEQVREAFTGYQAVFHLTVDSDFISDGDRLTDRSGFYQTAVLETGPDDPVNKVTAGAVGSYALHFDGNDRLLVDPAYSLLLDRGSFTQTAWIKPLAGAGASGIISQLDQNEEVRYPSIYMTDGFGLAAGFGDFSDKPAMFFSPEGVLQPEAWNFVAARFDGTTYSLFVNGVEVAQTDEFAGKKPYTSDRFNIGEQFGGDIDDVKIFTRPLSDLEITAMARTGWRAARLNGSTWTADVLPGLEGPYRTDVRGWDAFGHFTTGWDVEHQWSGVIDTLAPRFNFNRTIDPDNPNLAHYTFSVEDTQLDPDSIHQNLCDKVKITREYFNSSWYLATGVPPNSTLYRLSGSCSGDIRTTETTGFYACDLAGNCVMQEYPASLPERTYLPLIIGGTGQSVPPLTPTQSAPLAAEQVERAMQWTPLSDAIATEDGGQAPYVEIWTDELTPEDARTILHANIRGMVSDDGEVDSVQVEIYRDGELVYATRAAVYEAYWNAIWLYPPGAPPSNGVYTVRVTAVDTVGNQTLVERDITVRLLP